MVDPLSSGCPDELELWGERLSGSLLPLQTSETWLAVVNAKTLSERPHVQPDSFSTSTTRLSLSGCVWITFCRGPLLQDVALRLLLVLGYFALILYC